MAYFVGVGSIIFLLCAIVMLQSPSVTSSRFLQESGTPINVHLDNAPSGSRKNRNDPDLQQFFKVADLKLGKKIPIYFPMKEPSKLPPLLSKEEAGSIPFSTPELPNILKLFSIQEGSLQAKTMERTIGSCEAEPLRGETKFCATSMDSLIDSAHAVFGPNADIKVTATKLDLSSDPIYTSMLQNYTIAETPQEISTPKTMGCHLVPYAYAVYYCHQQFGDHVTRLFRIPLVGDNGWRVEALGLCHMDTSNWDPTHIVFFVLNTQPGKSPVCHFFSDDGLVWFQK